MTPPADCQAPLSRCPWVPEHLPSQHLPPTRPQPPPPDCQHWGAGSLPDAPLQPKDQHRREQNDLCDKNRRLWNLGRGVPVPAGLVCPQGLPLQPHLPQPSGRSWRPLAHHSQGRGREGPRVLGSSLTPPLFSWPLVPPVRADLPLLHWNTFARGPHPQEPSVMSVSGAQTF